MSFLRFKKNLYPMLAILSSLFILVAGLALCRSVRCSWMLTFLLAWLILFGCGKACLRVIPLFVVVGGLFAWITYSASGGDGQAAMAMLNRFGTVFLALAPGMSIEPIAMTRNLSQLNVPRTVTLGMLIVMSFLPVLKTEISRVLEASKTRGAGSILNPRIFYRACLIPLVTRLVDISDTLALSIETRGFALDKSEYTVYKREPVCLSDVIYIAGILMGIGLVVMA